ncbi:hypothetical protein MAPG_06532 [Magnaporthiopsis poae ATCC 64411]|uniref:Uncharacterized protein n=1 Tax=Magnaporthiopsis poae (strain ATCC 64411 / 73-15) TaxID=644358 RepID=A0A0C4E2A1_MAGP6|nr:hypothetical protein MAPG_06532 [Magnaporthiopsis poae ATCC 64411]
MEHAAAWTASMTVWDRRRRSAYLPMRVAFEMLPVLLAENEMLEIYEGITTCVYGRKREEGLTTWGVVVHGSARERRGGGGGWMSLFGRKAQKLKTEAS